MYEDLAEEIGRQLADGRDLRAVDLAAAARVVGCARPTASKLWHHGLAGAHGPGMPPLKERFKAFTPRPPDEQRDELRAYLGVIAGRSAAHVAIISEGLTPAVQRMKEILTNGSDITLTMSVLDQLGKITAGLATVAEKLGAPAKRGRSAAGSERKPIPIPNAADASDDEVRARLAQRAEELGDESPEAA